MPTTVELTPRGENKVKATLRYQASLKPVILFKLSELGPVSISELSQELNGVSEKRLKLALRSLARKGYIRAGGNDNNVSLEENDGTGES